ncbi:glycosyltransferase family 90 protein [Xylariaceae sp. FL1272]|nr:glycosyltransferase family 90 protein [Xylariaceae sp. FL1272]
MTLSQRSINLVALCFSVSSFGFLQLRFNTSAAFERPIHLSIISFALSGALLLALSRLDSSHRQYAFTKLPSVPLTSLPGAFIGFMWWLCACLRSNTSVHLVLCLILRTILTWRTIRTIHCSWDGLYAFLPLFLSLQTASLFPRSIHLPRHADDDPPTHVSVAKLAALALAWGLAVANLLQNQDTTGVICPAGWCIERLIPLAQLTAVLIDAIIVTQFAKLQQGNSERGQQWQTLGFIFLASAGVLLFLASWTSLDHINWRWSVFMSQLVVRDIAIDSITVSVSLICAIVLLRTFRPNLVGLLAVATSIYVLALMHASYGLWSPAQTGIGGGMLFLVALVGFGYLVHFGRNSSSVVTLHRQDILAACRHSGYALAVLCAILVYSFYVSGSLNHKPSPRAAMAENQAQSNEWMSLAAKSTSLETAVGEYRQRYGIPPPPNFDKWYAFATDNKSPVIDIFDQIHTDLRPFWGITPSVVRETTTYLLEHPALSMGGLIIKDGEVTVSPHVPGTHRWMVDVTADMIKPFAQWLPEMQLAFNLDDECRVSVPAVEMGEYVEKGFASQSTLGSQKSLRPFSSSQDPRWAVGFLDAGEEIWQRISDLFHTWSKSPILDEWVSSACPADAPVNHVHWWNRKERCRSCASPHMLQGFIRNWTLSGDVCHQPDLAYLHGFLTSPSAFTASHNLYPVFSQSKVNNFADILYPSPWNFNNKVAYDESRDVAWEDKRNSVFWRGGSSDGFATHGSWQMFLRARFVYMASRVRTTYDRLRSLLPIGKANEVSSNPSPRGQSLKAQLEVNVSFVGHFGRCDGRDCEAEHRTFYDTPADVVPDGVDFQEHWQHRHLVDLDGAAFSGRFLPFLESKSLPYRAGLFRTWWEERIHPWRHFIPLDLRLMDLWANLRYFAGPGSNEAKDIAEAGAIWGKQALRKEDMQIYMFRLLLEWGRIVDDKREELGFSL